MTFQVLFLGLYFHQRGAFVLLVSTIRAMREPLLRGTSGRLAPRFFICSYEKKTINFHQEPDGECNLNIWPMKRLILLVLGFICWQGVVQAKNYFYVTALEDSVCVIVRNNSMQFSFDGEEWNDFMYEEYDPSSVRRLNFYVDGIWKKMICQGETGNSTVIYGEDEEFSDIRNEIVLDCSVEAGYNYNYHYYSDSVVVQCCILLEKGQKLFLKGKGTYDWKAVSSTAWRLNLDIEDPVEEFYQDSVHAFTHIPIYFSGKNKFEVGGELMSLVDGEWADSTKMDRGAFMAMFAESAVADASNLKLPTELSGNCFAYMFYKCENLENAPELPATDLKRGCYAAMFSGCKSLEKAPELPAEKLEEDSYVRMFSNCSNLNYINVLSKDVVQRWVDGVSTSGEFIAINQYCEDLGPYLPIGDWTVVCSNDKPEEEPKEEPEEEPKQEPENCNCDTTVNGIYYKLDRELKTAEVTCSEDSSSPRYSGVLEIPETIVVDDTTYTVTSISKYAFYVNPESDEDSLIIDEIRLPKTILDIHTPFCCLPLPELPEYSSSMPNLVRQRNGNDDMMGSIPSKTDVKKIVISNESSLKFICRDIGAAILDRLYLEDKKVDAKMVLKEMTGSSSFTNLKVCVDSMWLVRETFEWIYDRNWWAQIKTITVTEGKLLSAVPDAIYSGVQGADLELLIVPCTFKGQLGFSFNGVNCDVLSANLKKDSIGWKFSTCDNELEFGYSFNDTLFFYGSMEEWCASPIDIDLPYSVLFIDGKEVKGNLVIPEGVTIVADNAFSKCPQITSVTFPQSMSYIGENAFANCTKIRSVTCYSPYPPEAFANTFANYNGYLYMPCDYFDEYDLHVSWGSFKHIECSSAEQADVEDLQINPEYDNAEFAWPATSGAHVYSLQIKKEDELVCTLNFNEDGQLVNIDFGGASSKSRLRSASLGYRFTVTGLQENTNYSFSLEAKDENEKLLKHYEGDFKTKSIDGSEGEFSNVSEIERFRLFEVKGDILVFECDSQVEVFDLAGRCLYRNVGNGTFKVPAGGIYLVRIGGKGFKVEVD